MGSYGIGVGRLLACIAEEHRDEDGLVWPVSVAPYHAYLVAPDDEAALDLYDELRSAGVEVLYDDRQESLGTKFKDADLIGAPIRLTLTPRSLKNGGVEVKLRREGKSRIVPVNEAVETARKDISDLEEELRRGIPAAEGEG
jgi:prolyl-tRNA synthetase